MARFRDGELDVLVGTTVVEVGVDVPEATMMVIEGADRFGLAQLHQLRGRVGRGTQESFCVLVSDSTDETAQARLAAVKEIRDGFELAERDWELRREGNVLGLVQSGLPELRVASLQREGHRELAVRARAASRSRSSTRPARSDPDHDALATELRAGWLAGVARAEPGARRSRGSGGRGVTGGRRAPARRSAGRVIAGTARGIRLAAPGEGTRPLADRVKQALFAILEPDLPGARVLDLFAGSGAGGIEALSRGAAAARLRRSRSAARSRRSRRTSPRTRLAGPSAASSGPMPCAGLARRGRRRRRRRTTLVLVDPPYDRPELLAARPRSGSGPAAPARAGRPASSPSTSGRTDRPTGSGC